MRRDVPLDDADAPASREAFVLVPLPGLGLEDGDEQGVFAPFQIRFSGRLENVWMRLIEGIKLIEVCFSKALPKLESQGFGQIGDDFGAVFCAVFAFEFFFVDAFPNRPVPLEDEGVQRFIGNLPRHNDDLFWPSFFPWRRRRRWKRKSKSLMPLFYARSFRQAESRRNRQKTLL